LYSKLLAVGFPEKVLKRSRPYVVLERNALGKLARIFENI
jgi:hypothetical protein